MRPVVWFFGRFYSARFFKAQHCSNAQFQISLQFTNRYSEALNTLRVQVGYTPELFHMFFRRRC
jgi:hypothetical protein